MKVINKDIEDREPFKSLLARIIANPDDDDPRLAVAQELELTGVDPERARFIRTSLELDFYEAQIKPGAFLSPSLQKQVQEVSDRYLNLLDTHSPDWTPTWFSVESITPGFHRGFIEIADISAATLLKAGMSQRLFGDAPIRHLNLRDVGGDAGFEKLLAHLHEEGIHKRLLSFNLEKQNLSDQSLAHLVHYGFGQLHWLGLAYNNITETGARFMMENFPRLQYAGFYGNPCNPIARVAFDHGGAGYPLPTPLSQAHPEIAWLQAPEMRPVSRYRALPSLLRL